MAEGPRGGSAFAASLIVTLGGSVLGAMLTMINEAMASRLLGLRGYGAYAIGMMILKLCEIVTVLGLPLSLLHFIPIHLSRSEGSLAIGAIVAAAAAAMGMGVAFAAIGWSAADAIARDIFHMPEAAPFIAILSLAIPTIALAELLGNVARGFDRPALYVLVRNLIPTLCYAAMLVVISRHGGSGPLIAVAYWLATAVAAVCGVLAVTWLVGRRLGRLRPRLQLRRLYGYAMPVWFNSIVAIAIALTDLVCLGLFADPRQVGMYRACMQAAVAFDLIWNACSAATAPRYAVLVAEAQWTRLQALYSGSLLAATVLTLPLLAVLVSSGGDLLGLLNPQFQAAAGALAILAAGHAAKTMFGAASVLLVLSGQQVRECHNGAAAAALNLTLNLVLVPKFGLLGAAGATATSLVALSALRCWQVYRVYGIVPRDPLLLRAATATAAVTLLVPAGFAAVGMPSGSGLPALVLHVAAIGCALAVLFWFACLSRGRRAAALVAFAALSLRPKLPEDVRP